MSDNSPFTGTVRFGPPYYDNNGRFALAGGNIIVNPDGPGIGPNKATMTDHITLEAIPGKPGRALIGPGSDRDWNQCASRRSNRPSSNIAATPMQIALSARLKAGQCADPR